MASNKVVIESNDIDTIKYVDQSLVITEGESSSPPPSVLQSGSTWEITLDCGRKGSADVAQEFVKSCGEGHVFSPGAMSDTKPQELNFYFENTIRFKINGQETSTNIYFGQGHRATRNNWWIGGSNVLYLSGKAYLVLVSSQNNEILKVYEISGGISDFQLTPIM